MNLRTLVHVLVAVAAGIVVGGACYGFARSWGGDGGVVALRTAVIVTAVAAGIGYFLAAFFRGWFERASRRRAAAWTGLVTTLVLLLFSSIPIALLRMGPVGQYFAWWALLGVVQLALMAFHFREALAKEPAREPARNGS